MKRQYSFGIWLSVLAIAGLCYFYAYQRISQPLKLSEREQQMEINRQNLQKWQQLGISSYELWISPYYSTLEPSDYRVVVNQNQIDMTRSECFLNAEKVACTLGELENYTVSALFELIDKQLTVEDDCRGEFCKLNYNFHIWGKVAYHAAYFFPEKITMDHPDWDDEEFWFTVTQFQTLP
ncbi:MAG TPA: DUF6174 domain-containing protein [Anaerolineales bacterium]|nr:DUF6174 domain-containing protein [Anaerolineales bacterium]